MGMTYRTGAERDRHRTRLRGGDARGEWLLLAVVAAGLLAIALTWAGRMAAFDATEAGRGVVDLRAVGTPRDLEPALAAAFDQQVDRRVAANALAEALADGRAAPLTHVGALARVRLTADELARLPASSVFARRLREARASAEAAGREVPATLPLLTGSDLAAIKPALAVRTRAELRSTVFWSAAAAMMAVLAVSFAWRWLHVRGDRVLLAAAALLVALGFCVMLSRPDPLRDTILVVRFAQGVVVGLALFLAASLVDVRRLSVLRLSYVPLLGAVALALALMIAGTGPAGSSARINLGPIQPIEAIRLLLVFFLAGYFARRWEVIRHLRASTVRDRRLPSWLDLPKFEHVLPVVLGVGVALVLFFALKDLGPALLLSLTFLAMFTVARGGAAIAAAGLLVLIAGFAVGHVLGISVTLGERVAMWRSPWENAVGGGDQVAQAIWAMASGGWQGSGAGLGAARYVPAGHTDLALAALAEELGAAGVLAVLVALGAIARRGLRTGREAAGDYASFLAVGMTLSLVVPALVMAGGALGLIPLTGVVTPFVSYGGSAMAANFAALGIVVACGRERRPDRAAAGSADAFAVPLRWVGRTLAAAAVIVVVVWSHAQVVSADELLVRPQLSRQADGALRYHYNPRVIDAAALVPRGTIFDREGLPLATGNRNLLTAQAARLSSIGADPEEACAGGEVRCYPFGGPFFHLLGDARTRLNWAASNSSFVERDAEGRLRGFDDRAELRRSRVGGEDVVAVRRDYAELVPLVRRRWEPGHPVVREFRERSRDVHLTIDARLQVRTAAIVEKAVRRARVESGAAVVIDADTGELLASVSYPWPGVAQAAGADGKTLLDRARYGLYPPGSTFKLVTAAAALRTDPSLAGLELVCSRLPDNRGGARLPGYGRPIRDDSRDRAAHGAIAMHDGLVRSCNAYFAQLAVTLGVGPLADAAGMAGITLSPSADPQRLRDTLPFAAFGQGDVVTTPLRMARVAAAIASGGVLRETPIVTGAGGAVATPWIGQASAGTLAGFMRDAVRQGTGRVLGSHPGRIAGKTGTAELDGRPSHAWFVGFAPHGEAARRIAFAVVLEHAGYGGASAASASGEIVTAAMSLGLVR